MTIKKKKSSKKFNDSRLASQENIIPNSTYFINTPNLHLSQNEKILFNIVNSCKYG